MSPPLLPMSPEISPFVPSSDTGRIELLSDHTSPTRDEMRGIERKIFANDSIVPVEKERQTDSPEVLEVPLDIESLSNIYSSLGHIEEPLCSSPIPRRSVQDRKLEVPLSPPASDRPPPWQRKNVSFREALTEVIDDLPPEIPKAENTSSDDIDAMFEEAIRPIAVDAERRIQQEQLQEADTTLRVPVPIMDFSVPIAPWNTQIRASEETKTSTCQEALAEMKSLHLHDDVWPLSGRVERALKWAPFPAALGKIESETISDDGLLEDFLSQPDCPDVNTLTWKPEGLRILDEVAESDEELTEGVFPLEVKDMSSLIRKRKFELHANDDNRSPQMIDTRDKKARFQDHEPTKADDAEMTFSALDALATYMSVRKGEAGKSQLVANKYFPALPEASQALSPAKPNVLNASAPQLYTAAFTLSPNVTPSNAPVPFVVSVSFLSNRKLARRVQQQYPSAKFIERDFQLYSQYIATPFDKANVPPKVGSSIADEADIIVSPSTGLICTTLQRIKQRPLPGRSAQSTAKERISRVSLRYERLLVFVHEGRNSLSVDTDAASGLDFNDCEAILELTNVCSALECDVQVIFVGGNEDSLAKWITAMMVKHCVTDPGMKLIQDETLWEIFLRRAGVNAFAAQVILANFKAPDSSDSNGRYGLGAFVEMSTGERLARFESLLGGRRVLTRVSRSLDTRWQR